LSTCHVGQNAHPVGVISKRRKWFVILIVPLVAGVVLALLPGESEPTYKGETLSD